MQISKSTATVVPSLISTQAILQLTQKKISTSTMGHSTLSPLQRNNYLGQSLDRDDLGERTLRNMKQGGIPSQQLIKVNSTACIPHKLKNKQFGTITPDPSPPVALSRNRPRHRKTATAGKAEGLLARINQKDSIKENKGTKSRLAKSGLQESNSQLSESIDVKISKRSSGFYKNASIKSHILTQTKLTRWKNGKGIATAQVTSRSNKEEEEKKLDTPERRELFLSFQKDLDCAREDYAKKNKSGCIENLKEIIKKAANAHEYQALMRSYEILGEVFLFYKEYEKGFTCFLQMRNLSNIIEDEKDKMVSYKKMGLCLLQMKSYEESIRCFKKQLEVAWEVNSIEGELNAYDNIGLSYYYLGELDKSIYYHDRMMRGKIEAPESDLRKTTDKYKYQKRMEDHLNFNVYGFSGINPSKKEKKKEIQKNFNFLMTKKYDSEASQKEYEATQRQFKSTNPISPTILEKTAQPLTFEKIQEISQDPPSLQIGRFFSETQTTPTVPDMLSQVTKLIPRSTIFKGKKGRMPKGQGKVLSECSTMASFGFRGGTGTTTPFDDSEHKNSILSPPSVDKDGPSHILNLHNSNITSSLSQLKGVSTTKKMFQLPIKEPGPKGPAPLIVFNNGRSLNDLSFTDIPSPRLQTNSHQILLLKNYTEAQYKESLGKKDQEEVNPRRIPAIMEYIKKQDRKDHKSVTGAKERLISKEDRRAMLFNPAEAPKFDKRSLLKRAHEKKNRRENFNILLNHLSPSRCFKQLQSNQENSKRKLEARFKFFSRVLFTLKKCDPMKSRAHWNLDIKDQLGAGKIFSNW